MRLLHTESFELEWFPENGVPPYAIVSHTSDWDEVLFSDMSSGLSWGVSSKKGFQKIAQCARMAKASYNLEWLWIDCCCIDRESEEEFEEAVNFTFMWYQQATVCFVYLSDVIVRPASSFELDAADAKWFTRGWTLQELIAPRNLEFYSGDWTYMGEKSEHLEVLKRITGVPRTVLENGNFDGFSVAQRMSWAAWRETSVPEDIAYCLVGLFELKCKFICQSGEGASKAMHRLQEEIFEHSEEQSIFAWKTDTCDPSIYRSLFADSPAEFKDCGDISIMSDSYLPHDMDDIDFGPGVTFRGYFCLHDPEGFCAYLNCVRGGPEAAADEMQHHPVIRLIRLAAPKGGINQTYRVDAHRLDYWGIADGHGETATEYEQTKSVKVKDFDPPDELPKAYLSNRSKGFLFRDFSGVGRQYHIQPWSYPPVGEIRRLPPLNGRGSKLFVPFHAIEPFDNDVPPHYTKDIIIETTRTDELSMFHIALEFHPGKPGRRWQDGKLCKETIPMVSFEFHAVKEDGVLSDKLNDMAHPFALEWRSVFVNHQIWTAVDLTLKPDIED